MDDLNEPPRRNSLDEIEKSIARIKARIAYLDAQVAAADALAEVILRTGYRVDHNGVTTLAGIDAMIPINDALAAYNQARKGET